MSLDYIQQSEAMYMMSAFHFSAASNERINRKIFLKVEVVSHFVW